MNLKKTSKNQTGWQRIVTPSECELKRLGFGILRLEPDGEFSAKTDNNETVIVILSGQASFTGNDFCFKKIGSRKDIFSGKPSAIYLPPRTSWTVKALTQMECAICEAPCDRQTRPTLITPENVIEKKIGRSCWSRKAHFILGDQVDSQNFFVGETFLEPGQWAFPPHRHDVNNLPEEVEMDEIYHFRLKPENGFGVQLVYNDDKTRDEAFVVRNGDTIALPEGYHPVSASPMDSVYILWMLAGPQRFFKSKVDDQYRDALAP
ncbi:MAG: 5-deoxy-glucuronate isomerase [Verrucomicrobiae bacterium]|nr:5-deoxy-glucuronate isomerase [Verrucomicrobiae bacterium]